MKEMNMKIAVVGAGGVGGFIGTLLASKYDNVTIAARGDRGESLKKNGITLISEYLGTVTAFPEIATDTRELEHNDLIFICVKNYSLEQTLSELKNAVDKDTVIIPVMNGVDVGDRIRKAFPDAKVIDSVIYIVTYSDENYIIHNDSVSCTLKLGAKSDDNELKKTADRVCAMLRDARINAEVPDDITLEIWRKFILNSAYNVSTARYRAPIGPVRANEKSARDYCALVYEAASVGRALGVPLTDEHIRYVTDQFYEYDDGAGSSFQRDVEKSMPTEIETFSGYVVKTALSLGLDVPVSEEYYNALLAMGVK